MGQLRELVLDLLPQLAGQEGKPLQQALHVRVCALLRQEPGQLRMGIRKFPALRMQKAQFVSVESVQLHTTTAPIEVGEDLPALPLIPVRYTTR